MNVPPYTLIHRGDEGKSDTPRDLLAKIEPAPIAPSPVEIVIDEEMSLRARRDPALDAILAAANNLKRAGDVLAGRTTVGIWDVGARVGYLPQIIEALNAAQRRFVFFEVMAAIPAGLISRPERVRAWLDRGVKLTRTESRQVADNVIDEDFFEGAESIRRAVEVDYLVGLTSRMVAFETEEVFYWNYFSVSKTRLVLVSTYGLRDYARKAGRPFEVAVGGLIVCQVLVEVYPELDFHPENRGCLFDSNEDRESIVETIRQSEIEPSCLNKVPEADRAATLALTKTLRTFSRPEDQPQAKGASVMTQVVIVVPGIMGSELRLEDQLIWPGPVPSFMFGYGLMNELMDDRTVATDLIRRYTVFSPQYETLLADLEACDFHEHSDPPTLFPCPYDWRRKNEISAETLALKIEEAVTRNGDATEVTIIAHSMGGLVARYYLESGQFTGRKGFKKVRRLIMLGTPHRGAPLALPRLLGQEKMIWLSAKQVKQAVSDPRFPGAYQLLPLRGEPFAWNEDSRAEFDSFDIYDTALASDLGLVAANMDAALAFQRALDVHQRPEGVRYFCFAGTRQKTATVARLLRTTGQPVLVRKVEYDDGGDGTVPFWSSVLTGFQSQPVGGEHSVIYKDPALRRTLAALMGKAGVLAADLGQIDVSLRERVVEPGGRVHVVMTFGAGVNTLEGQLRIERADVVGDNVVIPPDAVPVQSFPINYQGLAAETFGVTFDAPDRPGAYRVAYYPEGQKSPFGSDELFVQQRVGA